MTKKSKKAKIPKKIGGVKIPKGVRIAGDRALKLAAEHPVISDIVAAGLLAAAAALTGDKKLRITARELGEDVKEAASASAGKASRAKAAAKAAAGAMGKALRDELVAGPAGKRARGI
ncbi:hypothetical protein [Allosphingosinicella sp.]|uniref:hypothetical protein n=1 Tax=Allosphingosinicella sp. TaxID=2823234 RepID=UPI002FC15D33